MGEHLLNVRREKIERLRRAGINPYPYRFERTHTLAELKERFDELADLDLSSQSFRVAGRVMLHRPAGKIAFFHVEDMSARMQLGASAGDVDQATYMLVKDLDAGDFIGASGYLKRTKRGEPTLWVRTLELLCKPLRPLPEKFHGLKDKEIRYRQRELDWIMDAGVRGTFETRARAIAAVRQFMDGRGFLEVDVPYIQTTYGGAEARPFETRIHAIDTRAYLSISPELFLKRYLVGGFDRVYCIARNFRNEGIDATHNPEFTSMESYQAYADYHDVMDLVEDLFVHVFTEVLGTTKVQYEGHTIDVAKPWPRRPFYDLLKEHSGIDARAVSREALVAEIQRRAADEPELNEIDLSPARARGYLALDLFEHYCEKQLIQPAFVIDYPRETSPLCKVHREDPALIERFEAFLAGVEFGNAYSELNDPVEQRRLLEEQAARLRAGQKEAMPMDEAFAQAIEYGLPPTGGLGIGIDRLVMLLTGAPSIRDVIAFPLMRPAGKGTESRVPAPGSGTKETTKEPVRRSRDPRAETPEPRPTVWAEPADCGLDEATVRNLFDEHITEAGLRAHCIASAAAMRALAKHLGRSEPAWWAAGLLHDLDFEVEQAPDKHGLLTRTWLQEAGMDERLVRSMVVHNEGLGMARATAFEHILAAAETLTGLVRAVALVYPDKKIAPVKVKSVTKRLKDKRFAARVNRETIRECERAGLSVNELVEITLNAMKEVAGEIGL